MMFRRLSAIAVVLMLSGCASPIPSSLFSPAPPAPPLELDLSADDPSLTAAQWDDLDKKVAVMTAGLEELISGSVTLTEPAATSALTQGGVPRSSVTTATQKGTIYFWVELDYGCIVGVVDYSGVSIEGGGFRAENSCLAPE